MARGLYHQTGIGRNDMVLHLDHRGRWRIDLVTSAGGNHTDVTGREAGSGANQGYSNPENAFAAALDEQRRRGLRGKTHVWIQRGDSYESYEPEGDYLPNRNPTLYEELRDGGHPLDHHESDLYVKDSPRARAIIERHGSRYTPFTSDADRQRWLDVPFGYEPFWQSKQRPNGRLYHVVVINERTGSRTRMTSSPVTHSEGVTILGKLRPHRDTRALLEDAAPELAGADVEGSGLVGNPRGSTVDEHAKRELELYIENEYALIGAPNSIGKSIDANLRKKVAKGTYDPERAPQAWQYLIDEGAKRYAKAYSSSERDATRIFSAATRRAVAAEYARAWEAENLPPSATRS